MTWRKTPFVTLIARGNIFDITFCPHFSEHAFPKECEAKVEKYIERKVATRRQIFIDQTRLPPAR